MPASQSQLQSRYTRTWELLLSKKRKLQQHSRQNKQLSVVIQQYDVYYQTALSEKKKEYDALFALGAHIHSLSEPSDSIVSELGRLHSEIESILGCIDPT